MMGGFAIVGPKLVSLFGHHSRPASRHHHRYWYPIRWTMPTSTLLPPPLRTGTRRRVACATAQYYGETLLCQLPSRPKHTGVMLQQSTNTHKCLYRVYYELSHHGGARLFSTLSNPKRVPCIVLQIQRCYLRSTCCAPFFQGYGECCP